MPQKLPSRHRWLRNSFVTVMFLGAAISYYITPETCDVRGYSRKLEDLAKGKAHRKQMEREEREGAEPQRKHSWRRKKHSEGWREASGGFCQIEARLPHALVVTDTLKLASRSSYSFPVSVHVPKTGIWASTLCCVLRHQTLATDGVLPLDKRCCRSFA